MSAPRVLVNLTWLRPGEVGGSESYMTRILAGVAARPDGPAEPEVHLAVRRSFIEHHLDVAEAYGLAILPEWAAKTRAARVAAESSWLAREATRRAVSVCHHAGGTLPLAPFPLQGGAATVVTIHDVQYLAHPEYFSRVKRRFLGLQVPRVARRADVIAVPTNSVAAMIIEEFGVEAERVVVVPHGFPPPPGFPGRVEAGGPYLLYPAVMWPHKNHALLLEALAFAEQPDLRLVFTGAGGPCASAVTERVKSLGLTDRVEVLGRVSDDRLEALYRGAAGLVFPSRFEGFGAPLVEAMARGCPVIASTADAVREVVGDAGLLVDPDDVTGWARAIAAVLDGGVRGDLTSAGFRRAEDFSVARAVDAQVSAWRRAHGATGRVD